VHDTKKINMFYVGLIINILFQKRFLLDMEIIEHTNKGVEQLQLDGLSCGVCT
jgi:hypothetical protein